MSIDTQQSLADPGQRRAAARFRGAQHPAMLAELGLDPQRVAVERNREWCRGRSLAK